MYKSIKIKADTLDRLRQAGNGTIDTNLSAALDALDVSLSEDSKKLLNRHFPGQSLDHAVQNVLDIETKERVKALSATAKSFYNENGSLKAAEKLNIIEQLAKANPAAAVNALAEIVLKDK